MDSHVKTHSVQKFFAAHVSSNKQATITNFSSIFNSIKHESEHKERERESLCVLECHFLLGKHTVHECYS